MMEMPGHLETAFYIKQCLPTWDVLLNCPHMSTIQFEGQRDQLKHCVVMKSQIVSVIVCKF